MKNKDNNIGRNEETPVLDDEAKAALKKLAVKLLDDEDFLAEFVLERADVKNAVIERYLKSFISGAPNLPSGSAALRPNEKASTLKQAKELCELYLSQL